MDFQTWRHVFKLDPNKKLDESALAALVRSGTDAFLIGGTDGVDAENTFALYARLQGCGIPVALEMSHPEHAIRGFDHYFIPTVLNAGTVDWVVGHQMRAFERYGHLFDSNNVTGQGYIVLNPEAKVAAVTGARATLTLEEVVAYAETGHHLFRLPSLYLEYSGTLGSPDVVKEVKLALPNAHVFYGGGIDGSDTARMMAEYADTIVVGNIIYDNLEGALATVQVVR
ncbi:heptaprenylglyceryl phosphate synthase [Exiguobacterium sp. SH3S2]|uniref:heptaprenylglyceryl phosphate synthase n=1 Tax=unclassified Exiguobacterium TaxID=2644629 RepID=UPI001038D544|nr:MULTISPECIES: heptaprenylglyceryl phosphate synthase [unclassified Exiguobacterium]TCI26843.1 heptaprenylglyceryl phosphate synthase [Exiguobacterium sp. SH5S4]TCI44521.1 heptaprenylglyceryl phosphate synthase [Exiguobacterium sp. SH3S3]TCI56785.1 heptaprenylglyceryl phosphate synthase [Exiguobacterium sp. SH5S13]TCI59661.1 heptaprenylglyceryl phosphate synthase [Exiguobacterium sp. SH3S1]TCI60078.1 heptaprenylglyceryl phosphate synthase [Exiguobacterium sp. SH3S2]